jgi:HAMP domain-containing protein
MNLQIRILFGYSYLVTLLIVAAAGAALGFQQVASRLAELEKQPSVVAATPTPDPAAPSMVAAPATESLAGEAENKHNEQIKHVASMARRYAILQATLLILALSSLGFLSRILRRRLLDRLVNLATIAETVADGDRSRRATVGLDDEIGIVARQFNALLDAEQAAIAEGKGRLCQQRQLMLGLLESWPKKVGVFSLKDGDLIASNFETELREQVEASTLHFPEPDASAKDSVLKLKNGRKLQLSLLKAEGLRPIGWLGQIG